MHFFWDSDFSWSPENKKYFYRDHPDIIGLCGILNNPIGFSIRKVLFISWYRLLTGIILWFFHKIILMELWIAIMKVLEGLLDFYKTRWEFASAIILKGCVFLTHNFATLSSYWKRKHNKKYKKPLRLKFQLSKN